MQGPRNQPQETPAKALNQHVDDAEDLLPLEGVHKGVILTDRWGNEWDDTDDFTEIDFRLVDGPE